jgi:Leucine-rich repeat (LRR) protein
VNLSTLELGGNRFNGTIPESLSRLRHLRHLTLCYNRLTGTIPASLSRLRNLRHLTVHVNGLTGAIPADCNRLAGAQPIRPRRAASIIQELDSINQP